MDGGLEYEWIFFRPCICAWCACMCVCVCVPPAALNYSVVSSTRAFCGARTISRTRCTDRRGRTQVHPRRRPYAEEPGRTVFITCPDMCRQLGLLANATGAACCQVPLLSWWMLTHSSLDMICFLRWCAGARRAAGCHRSRSRPSVPSGQRQSVPRSSQDRRHG